MYLGNKWVWGWCDGESGLIGVHTFENVKATDSGNLRLVAEAFCSWASSFFFSVTPPGAEKPPRLPLLQMTL